MHIKRICFILSAALIGVVLVFVTLSQLALAGETATYILDSTAPTRAVEWEHKTYNVG